MPTKKQREEQAKAVEMLIGTDDRERPIVAIGDRIYAVLRKRTASGTNYLDFYAFLPALESGPRAVVKLRLTTVVARAIGARYDRKSETIRTTNDAHGIVSELAYRLWGKAVADEHGFYRPRLHVEMIG